MERPEEEIKDYEEYLVRQLEQLATCDSSSIARSYVYTSRDPVLAKV